MDLSKAFDCIPHDLLIAKLAAYGLDENSLVYIYSYLKRREQCVGINNTYSNFQLILSGIPQGSVLGPILLCPKTGTTLDGPTFVRKPVLHEKIIHHLCPENWSFLTTNLRCYFSSI